MLHELQPGTIPYRAVEWLRAQAKATGDVEAVYATAVVCEAVNGDVATFAHQMVAARDARLVKGERIPGRGMTFWWSLGKGAVHVRERAEEEDILPRRNRAPDVKPRPGEMFPGARGDEDLGEQPAARPLEQSPFVAVIPRFEDCVQDLPRVREPAGGRATARADAACERPAEKKERPAQPAPAPAAKFDAWYSGLSGEMVLQGVYIDADGDAILSKDHVRIVLAALSGLAL